MNPGLVVKSKWVYENGVDPEFFESQNVSSTSWSVFERIDESPRDDHIVTGINVRNALDKELLSRILVEEMVALLPSQGL